MFKSIKYIATALALIVTSPAYADGIVATAKFAAQACVNGWTGQPQDNAFLISSGFKQRGASSFVRPATNLGLNGHTDRASVKIKRETCEFFYGSDRNATTAFDAFQKVFRENGFRAVTIKSGSRQSRAFERNGLVISVSGRSGSAYSSYFTKITASIRGQ